MLCQVKLCVNAKEYNRLRGYLCIKRLLDIILAVLVLIITIPILIGAAIAIKLDSTGPTFFLQQRVGKGGRRFIVYKFRTMLNKEAENCVYLDDQRMTKVGRLLRNTSIDELPQLINIIRGDMSFIGPRPLLADYLPYYTESEMKRHDVLPGISGWAQVNGRNSISWEKKFQYDLEYVDKVSLKLDFIIFKRTITRLIAMSDIEREHIQDFDTERKGKEYFQVNVNE